MADHQDCYCDSCRISRVEDLLTDSETQAQERQMAADIESLKNGGQHTEVMAAVLVEDVRRALWTGPEAKGPPK